MKEAATDRPNLPPPRHISTLPAFPLRRDVPGIDGFGSRVSRIFTVAGRAWRIAEPVTPGPGDRLHLSLLRDLQRVLDLDAKVADGALQFAMAEQQLDGPQVLGPAVDQGRLGAAQRVGAVVGRVEPHHRHPAVDQPGVEECCGLLADGDVLR